jgi:hypothetical protein
LLTSTGKNTGEEIIAAIVAINADGPSTQGADSASGILYQDTPLSAPTLVSAVADDDTSVTVTWTDMTDATSATGFAAINKYKVEWRLTGSGTSGWTNSLETADGDTVTLQITGLTTLTEYDFRVSAQNIFGYGPANNDAAALSATTQGVPSAPAKPTIS